MGIQKIHLHGWVEISVRNDVILQCRCSSRLWFFGDGVITDRGGKTQGDQGVVLSLAEVPQESFAFCPSVRVILRWREKLNGVKPLQIHIFGAVTKIDGNIVWVDMHGYEWFTGPASAGQTSVLANAV
jgi:hypothetical protein